MTKTLLFVGEGDPVMVRAGHPAAAGDAAFQSRPAPGGRKFRAYDKATGAVLWETELPAGTTGAPMTYMFEGKQYIVVAIGRRRTSGVRGAQPSVNAFSSEPLTHASDPVASAVENYRGTSATHHRYDPHRSPHGGGRRRQDHGPAHRKVVRICTGEEDQDAVTPVTSAET